MVFSLSMHSFNRIRISLALSFDRFSPNIGNNETKTILSVTEKGRRLFLLLSLLSLLNYQYSLSQNPALFLLHYYWKALPYTSRSILQGAEYKYK